LGSNDGARKHYGIPLMRKRAEELGGSLEMHSRDGDGTQITVTVLRGNGHA
jgi:signal transduction histidine kinase